MVRNYKRKTADNKKYTKNDLVLAIDEAKRTTIHRTSKINGIPYVMYITLPNQRYTWSRTRQEVTRTIKYLPAACHLKIFCYLQSNKLQRVQSHRHRKN
ncbi:unnamed protein product [Ceutorhynchus assimilis]|uniref:Uncharacterized protein n=1 Tax=Ceutorhynchus assimilis TaxID=467358 RepID=A0A9N9Q9D7_9CUCU|nr:unnamed protein product [Ceutorhynchus assimilis]